MKKELSDRQLAKGCLRGDALYQKLFFDKYAALMMSLCLRYCDSYEKAQDVLQDAFVTAFEKMDQYSGKGSLGGWFRSITVNTALMAIRKEKRSGMATSLNELEDLRSEDFDVLDKLAVDELLKLVRDMPAGYKTVFNLFAIEGYGHKEIADKLGISESTSKTQFLKARQFLRKQIEALMEK